VALREDESTTKGTVPALAREWKRVSPLQLEERILLVPALSRSELRNPAGWQEV
jgi:hypothetical protein